MIPAEECMQEQSFTFLSQGETVPRTFAIERMLKRIARLRSPESAGILTGVTPVIEADARRIYQTQGIEQHRLRRLYAQPCREPILFLDWGDGTQVLADGNHRYVAASIRGEREIRIRVVPPMFWRLFEIDMSSIPGHDDPAAFADYVQNGFSGIH